MAHQVWMQSKSVIVHRRLVGRGLVHSPQDRRPVLVGLRVAEEAEREGLDITTHGETAYNR